MPDQPIDPTASPGDPNPQIAATADALAARVAPEAANDDSDQEND